MQSPLDLLTQHWDGKLPIDPIKIARSLNIFVYSKDYPFSGVYKVVDNEHCIFFNNTEPLNRQRFVIAHQIGHYINGYTKAIPDINDFYMSTDINEQIANDFAYDLLLPINVLLEAYYNANCLNDLSILFGLSTDAIGKQLLKYGIF